LSKLTLEVFSDNKQVVNLHKKFGFEIVSEKNKNGKKVFCMELSQRAGNESSY
jgi:RimJ/RimL family protein N-acetyltransferase